MDRFADLLNRLSTTAERNGKLKLLSDYFREAPDPDRGLALAVLTENLPISFPMRRVLADLIPRRADPVLYQLSRDYVGDTAETVALIWRPEPHARWNDLSLNAILTRFQSAKPKDMPDLLE
ncbi:MAG: ATP-dependent DNA ligase, partial [Aestuariivirgaceae bacterium]|nr:ATP-dependent DNA ligase [Aestuariivirgaceae bacterium]